MDLLIGDIVGCNRGREVAAFERFVERSQDVGANRAVIIGMPDQIRALGDRLGGLEVTHLGVDDELTAVPSAVDAAVETYCRTLSEGQAVELVTFDWRRETPFAIQCHTLHLTGRFTAWGWLLKQGTFNREDSRTRVLRAVGMSQAEVVDSLRDVMLRRKKLTMADLRRELEKVSKKFSKIDNPLTRYSGFISSILRLGEEAEVFRIDRSLPSGNPTLFLPHTEEEPPVVADNPDGSSDLPSSTDAENVRSPEESIGDEGRAADKDSRNPPQRRVEVFEGVLRIHSLGPFSRVRALLFEDLKALSEQGVYTPAALITATIAAGKSRDFSTLAKPPPWGIIERFLYAALSRVAILRDQNHKPLRPQLADLGTKVYGVETGFDAKIEREMLVVLIDELGDVSASDITDLAQLLYPNQSDSTARVESLLLALQSEKRLVERNKVFMIRRKRAPGGKRVDPPGKSCSVEL
jgi:hypothetical protein